MRLPINFITNLPLEVTSGGWSGISANIFDQLRKRGHVHFVGPIDPPSSTLRKAVAKLRRVAGQRSKFVFFSEERLRQIARQYETLREPTSRFEMFHGATPWVMCRPRAAYGAYVDATFRMYLDIFSDPDCFDANDVTRIAEAEKTWMQHASILFFGSRWVRDLAVKEHDLDLSKTHVVWVGGHVPVPKADTYSGGHSFLFISLNFEKKGGYIAVKALQEVRRNVPDAELVIIGERPPVKVERMPGVRYAGRFNKNDPAELAKFSEHLASARALVHPTAMDTMGMVLIEAAYFGCPSIASRRFGIPELVLDGETGLLLNPPISSEAVAAAMNRMCDDGPAYREMRRRARAYSTQNQTWDALGERLWNQIVFAAGIPVAFG